MARHRGKHATSCGECRRRKKKCNQIQPCALCVAHGKGCYFPTTGGGLPVAAGQPRQGSSSAGGSGPSPPTSVPTPSTSTSAPGQPGTAAEQQGGSPSGSGNVKPHARDTDPVLPKHFHRIRKEPQVVMNKSRVLQWSHMMGAAPEFGPVGDCYEEACGKGNDGSDGKSFSRDADTRALVARMGDLLRKCKDFARRIKLSRPSRCPSCPGFDLVPPPRETADPLTGLYFTRFESTHRILHMPTFKADYERYWSDPKEAPPGLSLKVLLVIAIGSGLGPPKKHGGAEAESARLRNTAHQWVYAAQTWLSGPLEKDRLDITGIQIHCLVILARLIFSVAGDLVWISTGSLVQRAMQIGLHRDPKHLPAMSVPQAEIRRRLWATVLELAVQSSLDAAMPPRISLDDFDTEPPSNYDDAEITLFNPDFGPPPQTPTRPSPPPPPRPHPRSTFTETSIQLALLDSLPVRLRVLQLLNRLRSEINYRDVLELSEELTKACRACTEFGAAHEASGGVTAFHRNLLDHLVRRFLMPLHCPFASRGREADPQFNLSHKVSLAAARALLSPEPDDSFSRLMTTGGGLFREGFRYASTVVCKELLAQVKAQRADGSLHRDSQYRELLKRAVGDMTAFSLDRIRHGETNIKSFMFLCMIMAQVEAVEAGVPYEQPMALGGRDSLELCLGLLEDQAALVGVAARQEDEAGFAGDQFEDEYGYGPELNLDFFLPGAGFS